MRSAIHVTDDSNVVKTHVPVCVCWFVSTYSVQGGCHALLNPKKSQFKLILPQFLTIHPIFFLLRCKRTLSPRPRFPLNCQKKMVGPKKLSSAKTKPSTVSGEDKVFSINHTIRIRFFSFLLFLMSRIWFELLICNSG